MLKTLRKALCSILVLSMMGVMVLPAMAGDEQKDKMAVDSLAQMYQGRHDNDSVRNVYNEILRGTDKKIIVRIYWKATYRQ